MGFNWFGNSVSKNVLKLKVIFKSSFATVIGKLAGMKVRLKAGDTTNRISWSVIFNFVIFWWIFCWTVFFVTISAEIRSYCNFVVNKYRIGDFLIPNLYSVNIQDFRNRNRNFSIRNFRICNYLIHKFRFTVNVVKKWIQDANFVIKNFRICNFLNRYFQLLKFHEILAVIP